MNINELIEKHAADIGYPRDRHRACLNVFAIELLENMKADVEEDFRESIEYIGFYIHIDKALEELRK